MDVTECEHILEEAGTPPDILEKIDPGFKQYLGKKMQKKRKFPVLWAGGSIHRGWGGKTGYIYNEATGRLWQGKGEDLYLF